MIYTDGIWCQIHFLSCDLKACDFMAGPKPMRTEFGIHQRLESCEAHHHSKSHQVWLENSWEKWIYRLGQETVGYRYWDIIGQGWNFMSSLSQLISKLQTVCVGDQTWPSRPKPANSFVPPHPTGWGHEWTCCCVVCRLQQTGSVSGRPCLVEKQVWSLTQFFSVSFL